MRLIDANNLTKETEKSMIKNEYALLNDFEQFDYFCDGYSS